MLPDHVQTFIDAEIAANQTDFSDLRAVILNGTLKPSPTPSHTGPGRPRRRRAPVSAAQSRSRRPLSARWSSWAGAVRGRGPGR